MRFSAGSNRRKVWGELFFQNDFQKLLTSEEAGSYRVPLEMVRLAPSASNKQPWRIIKNQNEYHFYLQHTPGYAKFLAYDLQRVDMGIAMAHFELTAQEQGIIGKWVITPQQDVIVPQNTEYIGSWQEE